MRGSLWIGVLAACIVSACAVNEIDMPEKTCTAPLRRPGPRLHVDFENPAAGQISAFRWFVQGSEVRAPRDTAIYEVMSVNAESDSFLISDKVCRETYVNPFPEEILKAVYHRAGDTLRPSPFGYEGGNGLALRPQGPIIPFQGLAPADTAGFPEYGRIAGLAIGGRVLDTVSVRFARSGSLLQYWVYSDTEGPLVMGFTYPNGGAWGWVRIE